MYYLNKKRLQRYIFHTPYVFLTNNLIVKFLFSAILLTGGNLSFSQDTLPGLTFGGKNNDIGYAICHTEDEGYLLAGSTRSFGAGSSDIYIVRLNKFGSALWEKIYGGEHYDAVRSVTPVHDGFVLTGDVWGNGNGRLDTYLIKIDNTGTKLWDRHFGTKERDNGFKVVTCRDGGFLVMGYSRGFQSWGSGDFFVIRTDGNGNELWQNHYGANYDDYGMDIVENQDGSILMLGTKSGFYNDVQANYIVHDADILLIKTDENGNELWRKTYGGDGHDFGYAITLADDGFYLLGSTQSFGNGSFDMLLIKTDNEGNELWHKTFGGEEYEYGIALTMNNEGDLYLFGTTKSFGQNESADYYLVKTDSEGNKLWELTAGGDDVDFGNAIIANDDNGCTVTGQSKSYGAGKFDILVVKVNKNGLIENLIDGIDSLKDNDYMIYPNPVSVRGNIKRGSANNQSELLMELFTGSGQFVHSYSLKQPDYQFSVESLPTGTYIYRIHLPGNSEILFSGKLIIR